jgi:hypothetical protein
MIRRREDGAVVITQTAHGWLAGQFAMYWGNEYFQIPALHPELILAAANHDNGWFLWEQTPWLGPNGCPLDFVEMPAKTHLTFWQRGIEDLAEQSRYSALLVSMHARFLVEGRLRNNPGSADDTARLTAFLETQHHWEASTVRALETLPYYTAGCQRQALEANLRLLQIFDWLSLLLCMNTLTEAVIVDVPGQTSNHRLEIRLRPSERHRFTVDPWPFNQNHFEVMVQAHQLPAATFDSDEAYQAAWRSAEVNPLVFTVGREG